MAESSAGSRKWRTSDWAALLRCALKLIDTLQGDVPWSFGGGTALAVHLGHRISYDVDIFLANADTLTELSPNANPKTRALLAGRKYEFPGNYLKLKLDEGEIDFVLGGKRTGEPTWSWNFEGRSIQLETPWEIAIKKLFHRPSTFKLRDIFDLTAVLDSHAEKLSSFMPIVADKLDRAIDRTEAIVPTYEKQIVRDVNPTALGKKYATQAAADGALAFLKQHASH
jgi:hypothetical protein